jgi:hypothetical protein
VHRYRKVPNPIVNHSINQSTLRATEIFLSVLRRNCNPILCQGNSRSLGSRVPLVLHASEFAQSLTAWNASLRRSRPSNRQLSVNAQDSLHEHYKHGAEVFSEVCRMSTDIDLIHSLRVTSDPLIANIRPLPRKQTSGFAPDVL